MSLLNKKKHKVRMTIKYKCDSDIEELKIFGEKFVKNNQSHCKIYINEKKHNLVSILKIKPEYIIEGKLSIVFKIPEKNERYEFNVSRLYFIG